MKYPLILFLFCMLCRFAMAQSEVTPEELQKIKAEIERQVPVLKAKLIKGEYNTEQVEFSVDTFRIEQVFARRLKLDISTMGMVSAINEKSIEYDRLLNKYYNRLLKSLRPEDKKELITAQKSWLVYRDAEAALINMLRKDEYSGGGSIQSLVAEELYVNLVVGRTLQVFNHYDSISKDN